MSSSEKVPTVNDPVPWSAKIKKDGFNGDFDRRPSDWLLTKGIVYDYWYHLKVKKGEKYKLITHGFSWVMVPYSFGNKELKAFHELFAAVENY